MRSKHPRIPEHKQLTRLQLYIIASAMWPWLSHPLRLHNSTCQ